MHGEIFYGCFCQCEDDARASDVCEVDVSNGQVADGGRGRGVSGAEALVVRATVVLAEPEYADGVVAVDTLEGE